jgi:nucleotide-binding universal stress UspA family protein
MISNPIKRILVATDMSEFADAAVRFGDNLRRLLGSSITIVYANEPFIPYDMFDAAAYASVDQAAVRESLERRLHEHLDSVVGDPAVFDVRFVDGHPAHVINTTANEINADLIIMGTHGRTGFRRVLMGSIAERVVHESSRPVLTVKQEAADAVPVKSILCPVNFTDVAHEALDYACVLAQALDAELVVVHVMGDLEASLHPFVEEDFSPWVTSAVSDRCKYVQLIVREGHAAEEVLRLSDERKSMIVIGAQHRRFSDSTVIGTTTERVIRFAKQPVLTVIRQPETVQKKRVSAA